MALKKVALRQMFKQARVVLVLCLSLSLVFTNFTPVFAASQADARTKMKHNPPDYFVPAHRIQLDVRVSDPKGVKLVRCYFKAAGETDFVFVPMSNTGKNSYSGVLPAPSATSERIEYLFLSVNAENVIVKSQTFVLEKKDKDQVPAWQDIPMENEIKVSMELDQVPSELPGFSDNIAMDVVESGLRFGIVAGGLYQLSTAATASSAGSAAATTSAAAASTTGAAASAVSAGTVTAGAVGMSTAGIVGLGALGAVAVGGVAAASSEDSEPSSSGSSSNGSSGSGSSGGFSDVTVSQRNIRITMYDHGAVDGDEVRITLNGRTIVSKHSLVGPPGTTWSITLNNGSNTIQVTALSEGYSSPNTATLVLSNVTQGKSTQTYRIDKNESASLIVAAP